MGPLKRGFADMSHNCLAVVPPFLCIVTFGSVLSTEFPGMMNAAELAPSTEGFVGNGRGS